MGELMADSTHGPLFRLKDVGLVVEEVVRESGALRSPQALALLTGQVVGKLSRAGVLTFPVDEPVYVLRGQDPIAPAATRSYVEHCGLDVSQATLDVAMDRAHAMELWQAANPDRVKVPDTEEGS
jgi:hypothetical protein